MTKAPVSRKTIAAVVALAALTISAVFLVSCGKTAEEPQQKSDTPAKTTTSQRYTISLEGNPTTGYEWTYVADPEGIVKEVSYTYATDQEQSSTPATDAAVKSVTGGGSSGSSSEPMVGVGGTYTWEFEGAKAGTTVLTFTYARSWESEGNPISKTYELSVDDKGKITEVSVQKSEGAGDDF